MGEGEGQQPPFCISAHIVPQTILSAGAHSLLQSVSKAQSQDGIPGSLHHHSFNTVANTVPFSPPRRDPRISFPMVLVLDKFLDPEKGLQKIRKKYGLQRHGLYAKTKQLLRASQGGPCSPSGLSSFGIALCWDSCWLPLIVLLPGSLKGETPSGIHL